MCLLFVCFFSSSVCQCLSLFIIESTICIFQKHITDCSAVLQNGSSWGKRTYFTMSNTPYVTAYLEDGGLVDELHQLVAVQELRAAAAADAV